MLPTKMLLSVLFVTGVGAGCTKTTFLFITTPTEMEALSGSCLQIPCNFSAKSDFDNKRETFAVWIRSDSRFSINLSNVIFNSSKTVNTYPMHITGNLSSKNCTTFFSSLSPNYTDTYFLRIENKPFMATASCNPLKITVRDNPLSPRIKISGPLRENESATITCSAVAPCPQSPPELAWTLQKDPPNKMEENADRTFSTKIQETITLSDKHNGVTITCSVRYRMNDGRTVKTADVKKILEVSYAPKDTLASISPSRLVSAGSLVNLSCSSRANPPVSNFAWFRKSKDETKKVSEEPSYHFNATGGGVYYCVATNNLGSQTSPDLHLSAEGPEQPGTSWGTVVGGVIGVTVFFSVLVAIWWFKSKHSTSQQPQVLTGREPTNQERVTATEKEDVHYAEFDFPKRRPAPSFLPVQDNTHQQDSLYAQVNVSKTREA